MPAYHHTSSLASPQASGQPQIADLINWNIYRSVGSFPPQVYIAYKILSPQSKSTLICLTILKSRFHSGLNSALMASHFQCSFYWQYHAKSYHTTWRPNGEWLDFIV